MVGMKGKGTVPPQVIAPSDYRKEHDFATLRAHMGALRTGGGFATPNIGALRGPDIGAGGSIESDRAKFLKAFEESKKLGYTDVIMGDAAHDLNALAAGLGYTFEGAKETLEREAAKAARETTARATAAPRLKWERDRLPDETPAHFAHRAGYQHRGEIYSEDRELHRRLNSWLRSHAMPEGIDIPTLPEWNDRQVASGAGVPVVTDEVREYHRALKRVAGARYRGAEPA